MADISVQLSLPTGATEEAEVPADVPVGNLLSELVTVMDLPTQGPDGALVYQMRLKRTEHVFQDMETLADGGVQDGDRLIVTTEITAGSKKYQVNSYATA